MRCETLCRGFRDVINGTVEIKYKLALARAGKVELGQSRLCIADRLEALRTPYTTTAALSLDALPFIPLPDEVVPHWPDMTEGFIPFLTNYRADLVLWRPVLHPGPRSAQEERRSIPRIMRHLLEDSFRIPPAVMCALAVDLAQDLLVFSRPARPEITPAECYVYSISEGGPHPKAGGLRPFKIPFHFVIGDNGFGTTEDLQIFGDVVAWSVTDNQHSAAVISSNHVVLVTAQSLSVYKFDEFTQHAPPPASLATALCVLELPRLNASRFAPYVRAYMQFPPSAPSRDAADRHAASSGVAFGLDPAQTVLVVTLLHSTDIDPEFRLRLDPKDRNVSERFAIFVPLATLFKLACPMPLRAGIDRDTTQTQAWARRRTVPWAQWGPEGTRIVRFEYISHISVMGSRCAFMLYDRHAGTLHTVLFDVRRGARDNSDAARERLENVNLGDDDSASELVDVREVLAENLSFAEEVRTTFPAEVVHKAHPGWSAGFLLEDCVAISQQLRVTHPGVGYQGYDPINWL
uniref:Succinate-semialdehyde dehydrogenase (EC) n=1 Tax=Ganoderma boninense TaxID=34458 RepID=A0A5K1K371_9APHY|nr:Succinate-semialdehyde dehydrogenase (EC [Ganoderma boninense]